MNATDRTSVEMRWPGDSWAGEMTGETGAGAGAAGRVVRAQGLSPRGEGLPAKPEGGAVGTPISQLPAQQSSHHRAPPKFLGIRARPSRTPGLWNSL